MSEVARRRQMNPVVEVAAADVWESGDRGSALSQVIRGESNEEQRQPPPTRAAGELQ